MSGRGSRSRRVLQVPVVCRQQTNNRNLLILPNEMSANKHLFVPKCPGAAIDLPCWLCKACDGQVHPVDAYRCWDDMWGDDNEGTRAHWSPIWLLASSFLRAHGYELETELVDCPMFGKRLVTPHDRLHSQVEILSLLVCPARQKDGTEVFIKSITMAIDSQEYPVNMLLNSVEWRFDSRNHTIPALDVLYFQPDTQHLGRIPLATDMRAFVVMPKLSPLYMDEVFRPCGNSKPDIRICLEFAAQTTEGLCFMHELGIFHGDISDDNILSACLPSGKPAYYFIDFQASGQFTRPWKESPRILAFAPPHLRYPYPYGLSTSVSADPFAADVFGLGLVLRGMYNGIPDADKHFEAVPGFVVLVNEMCEQAPERRPTAAEASRRATELRSSIPKAARVPGTDLTNMHEAQGGTIMSKPHIVE